jgi:hypothetical protein
MKMNTILLIGDREISMKFTAKTVMTIEKTGWEALYGEKKHVQVEQILNNIDQLDVLIYLFRKSIDWKGSGAKPEEAEDLYDAYMDAGELDTGERYRVFQMEIASAIAASRGIDLKKTLQMITDAQTKAAEEAKVEHGIGA